MTTAWILPGGAAYGAIQVGTAEALLAAGIVPDLLIGTSVGALNAAWLAGDPTPAGATRLRGIWQSIKRADVLPLRPRTLLSGALHLGNHVVGNDRLSHWLRRTIRFDLIEDAPVPLTITASDLVAAEPVYLDRGDVVTALLASAAVPGVLPPVRIGDRWLVDGWIMANAPLSRAAALGADAVYVLPCGGVEPYERLTGRPTFRLFDDDTAGRTRMLAEHGLPNGATAINQALVGALVARTIREEFATWTPRLDVYLPPGPCVDDLPLFSFAEVPGLMDAARRLAEAWLPTARPVTPEEAAIPDRLTGVID
jgi:NTE family protein